MHYAAMSNQLTVMMQNGVEFSSSIPVSFDNTIRAISFNPFVQEAGSAVLDVVPSALDQSFVANQQSTVPTLQQSSPHHPSSRPMSQPYLSPPSSQPSATYSISPSRQLTTMPSRLPSSSVPTVHAASTLHSGQPSSQPSLPRRLTAASINARDRVRLLSPVLSLKLTACVSIRLAELCSIGRALPVAMCWHCSPTRTSMSMSSIK